jgi:hypothetical protein
VGIEKRQQLFQQTITGHLEGVDRAFEALEELRANETHHHAQAGLREGVDIFVVADVILGRAGSKRRV